MCRAMEEMRAEAAAKAAEKAVAERDKVIVFRMLSKGQTVETIVDLTDIPIEKVIGYKNEYSM